MPRRLPGYYDQPITEIDFRLHPELYRVGKGEQGVLMVEPYKSELLPHWRFRTPEVAEVSAQKLYEMFLDYGKRDDFVGMDMARKFLQMGFTRARRYANYKGGKKYQRNPQTAATGEEEATLRKAKNPQRPDALTNEKAQAAAIFQRYYKQALEHPTYQTLLKKHQDNQKSQ